MSEEEIKAASLDLAMAAQHFLFEKEVTQPQLVTAHIGELTLTIMVVATTADMGVSDRLGAALSKVADSVMNEVLTEG